MSTDKQDDARAGDCARTDPNKFGICYNCGDMGMLDEVCGDCENEFYGKVTRSELFSKLNEMDQANLSQELAHSEYAFDEIDGRKNYGRKEREELFTELGAGECLICGSFGPNGSLCLECGDQRQEWIHRETPRFYPGYGRCPVCRNTGRLDELCKNCAKWFYSKIPDKYFNVKKCGNTANSRSVAKNQKPDPEEVDGRPAKRKKN